MANSLFNQIYGGGTQGASPTIPAQNPMMDQIRQFASIIRGNPQEIVQNLMQTGKMTQAQFDQYSQMANQMLGRV